MIVSPIRARSARLGKRLDARFFCAPGVRSAERILMLKASGIGTRTVGGEGGFGKVLPTTRSKRVYAAPGEAYTPYLRPYDVFDYLPQEADRLSQSGTTNIESLMPEPGCILQTCSGRNLGPLAYADEFISGFAISDDMLRLHIEDERERFYVLAFLSTPTGQSLLTRSKTGGVIDHLAAGDLSGVEVPIFSPEIVDSVAELMATAIRLRQEARLSLAAATSAFERSLPALDRSSPMRDGWSQRSTEVGHRLDAAFHDPLAVGMRRLLLQNGGVKVRDVAETFMLNRYKRVYVAPEHGRCIVSGRQLLQTRPVNLQYIAAHSLSYEKYALGEGTIAFGARGRAEDRIAQPALITSDRADWLASHNLMRVRAREGVSPGWLYLCLASWQVQVQVKASAFGSVVDVVDPAGLDEVILPAPESQTEGDVALQCWRDFATATATEDQAVSLIEAQIHAASGVAA